MNKYYKVEINEVLDDNSNDHAEKQSFAVFNVNSLTIPSTVAQPVINILQK